uniref:G-protein coupled receptors family 1 profile domain-containing protein n=1 Tax=Octopus bimaculoides TaxID=37653 RepID=A0A0L8FQP1_OCTBM
MIVGFNYIAMTITGAMHLALGIFCFICSIIAFTTKEYYKIFVDIYSGYLYNNNLAVRTAAGSLIASLWILAVGVFGIIAGLKKNPEHRTYLMVKIL